MKPTRLLGTAVLALSLAGMLGSCKKTSPDTTSAAGLSDDETSLVAAAGFNSKWVEKKAEGSYPIEGDMLLSKAQLQEMAGATPSHNFIVADEEHYRTYNLVSTTGNRTITVSLASGFPTYYSDALNQVIARYNSYGLTINFSRVSSGGEIVITAANLGTSGGGCILGQASGFPTSSGNPSSGFTLSNSSCALSYINSVTKADEVMAHEMGHCIGFRHTDYKRRTSCGPGGGETAGSIGAVHIDGTPTNVSGSYNSWMMACTNGDNSFSADDVIALKVVY